jgi:hypothetical protein
MKKTAFLVIIMTILCLFIPNAKIVNANYDLGYARIVNEETPFYSDDAGQNLLFYLPYTYYVKVINANENFYHIEYGGYSSNPIIDGYAPKDALLFDGLTIDSPYPSVIVSSSSSCALYESAQMSNPLKHIFKDRIIKPYGLNYANNGEIIYYVSYNDTLGYVYESDLFPFTIENHKNPLTFLTPEPEQNSPTISPSTPQQNPENEKNNFFSLRIVIIICLGFAGVLALIFSLRSATKKTPDFSSYYEENDYE